MSLLERESPGVVMTPDNIRSRKLPWTLNLAIAANIANTFGEANATGRGALIASGLVLFAITLVVNMAARAIIYRRREFRDSAA